MPGSGFWKSKPPLGTQLDRGHPLANGLRAFFTLNEGAGERVNDLVQGTAGNFNLASTNDPIWTPGREGYAIKSNGADSGGVTIPESPWLHPTYPAITLMARVEGPSTTTGAPRIFGHQVNANNSPFHNFMLLLNTTNWTVFFDASAYVIQAKVTGEICTLAGTYDGANVRRYHNGQLVGTTARTGLITNSAGQLVIAGDGSQGAGATEGFQAPIYWCAMWARVLTQAEIMSMYADPFQIMQPPVWRRWFVVSGGVTHQAAAVLSVAASISPAGTTQYAAESALASSALLASPSQLTLGASASLGSAVSLTAEASIIRPAEAVLSATGSLSPTAQATYSAAVALDAVGALTPNARATYAAASSLAAGISLAADATLSGIQEAEAALSAQVSLSPNARMTYRAASALSASGALSGEALATRQASAALSATGTLTVIALLQKLAAASLSVSGSLNVGALLQLGVQAELGGTVSMLAAPNMTYVAQALLPGLVLLSAEAIAEGEADLFQITGTLDVDSHIGGTLDTDSTAVGNVGGP